MTLIYAFFIFFFSFSLYQLYLHFSFAPQKSVIKNFNTISPKNKKTFNEYLILQSKNVAKKIKKDTLFLSTLNHQLYALSYDFNAKEFIIYNLFLSIIYVIICIPFCFIVPVFFPLLILFVLFFLFEKINEPKKTLIKKSNEIEIYIPSFVTSIAHRFKTNKNVGVILEEIVKNTKDKNILIDELNKTMADMKISAIDQALIRLKQRTNSTMLNETVNGLLAVYRGDAGDEYFSMLSEDYKNVGIKKMREIAARRPAKVKKYQLYIIIAFVIMLLTTIMIDFSNKIAILFS